MAFSIQNMVETLWDEWNVHVAVLISLFFQVVLIFLATARKRTGNIIVNLIIWSAYMVADWVPVFAIGLISNGQRLSSSLLQFSMFSQSVPNEFWILTVLMFLAGAIKYAEQTRALYLACFVNFKDSMVNTKPNYARLMEEYTIRSAAPAQVPVQIANEPESGT
ncbi:hypothetical protein F0562_008893 [Nyssa sinensis]|uniref:DUF4220 domain-containing protein n=1 Tax=Nyssa sinensis TaxID=561372 RepID=A0A5J5AA16_9ASTE|nr:hypothetical protein F0562_008893 [Nyssa sinensis]